MAARMQLPWAWAALLFLAAAAAAAAAPGAPPMPSGSKASTREADFRLPKTVMPNYYRLVIRPDYPEDDGLLGSETYSGDVVIRAKVEQPVSEITFHKASTVTHLEIICVLKVKANGELPAGQLIGIGNYCDDLLGDTVPRTTEVKEDPETEKFTIFLSEELAQNQDILIVFQFWAKYPEGGLTGFYVSTYEEEGRQVAMLTTKFEPTHARKAFPCFDEPSFKAKFDLIVKRKDGIEVISNMEEKWRAVDIANNPYVGFETSPKMSPYLLVFIVFEEDMFVKTSVVERPLDMVTFSTWGRKYMIEQVDGGRLSQIEGPAALDFLERYTNIAYNETMTKMDMAAIPDFQSGAMENWALVTYRETALIYNEKTGTTTNYKRVVDVIAHELVHMWFGNLVTCDWWSEIWLNEGFATYLQYLVVHERYPNWHMLERFVLDEQMTVYGTDSSVNVAPLTDPSVVNPEQIGNHFSSISYNKGGAILRQIRNVMGEEKFVEGVRAYLQEKQLDSATPKDLIDNLVKSNVQSVTRLNNDQFRTVLEIWTTKGGFPVINVRRDGNKFNITQERYLLSGEEEAPTTYPVYLTYTTSADDAPPDSPLPPVGWFLHEQTSVELEIENITNSDWVLFNAYQGGYYRVNYEEAEWLRVARTLDAGEEALRRVAPLDRAALVDNALALARSGHLSYENAFRALRFLRHDTAFEPWAAARAALAHVQRMLGHDAAFKEFIAYIIEKAYLDVGFDIARGDAHIEKVHRVNVLTLACSAGYEDCLKESRKRLLQHLSVLPIQVEPDLQSVVFCYGLQNDTGALWQQLWATYPSADSAQRATLTAALGCINHRDTLKEFLQKSLTDEVRSQDAYTVFSSVYSNPFGVNVALDFLTFWGYDKLDQKYGAVRNAMSTLINGLSARLMTEEHKEQLRMAVEAYAPRHDAAVAAVAGNIAWLKEHDAAVVAGLRGVSSYTFPSAAPRRAALAAPLALLGAALLALLR